MGNNMQLVVLYTIIVSAHYHLPPAWVFGIHGWMIGWFGSLAYVQQLIKTNDIFKLQGIYLLIFNCLGFSCKISNFTIT